MTGVKRSVAYGSVVTLGIAVIAFLVDRTAFVVINEVEKVIEPCQHSGTWDPEAEACRCLGPWNGTYCGTCTCQNGAQCTTLNVQVPIQGTLWGCACTDKFVGSECEQCNANLTNGRCVGECQAGYYGADCDILCSEEPTFEEVLVESEYEKELQLLEYGGTLRVCSGHGKCGFTGECECEPLYFRSEDGRSSCARTCPRVDDKSCAGHGKCVFREEANVVACVCDEGYLKEDCSAACPGVEVDWIQRACSGRGACSLSDDGDTAVCECGELYRGDACEYKCPTGALIPTSEACSGHGTCSLSQDGFPRAVCQCNDPFTGPGCGCEAASTCSGHGNCRADGTCECIVDPDLGYSVWRGTRCDRCIPGHFGSDCLLKCTPHPPADHVFVDGKDIHCHGRGTCAVANFGLADESVVCGACTGEFATESHCRDCKDHFYPKFESVLAAHEADPNNELYKNPDTKSCTTYANRATCNYAGEPTPLFGLVGGDDPPCACEAPKADAFSYCTECLDTFYPSDLAEDPKNACSRRCVDSTTESTTVDGFLTLECLNDGVCAPDGERCECKNGFSGIDCGIACGDTGTVQCSGHGACVSSTLQQFLEFEIGKRGGTASRCVCSPGDELSEDEKLRIFKGEETLEGDSTKTKRDFYGDTCQHQCLPAPWRDGQECNNEMCKSLPIQNDDGTPILRCTQDSQCGEWKYSNAFGEHVLQFEKAPGEALSEDEKKLRAALSAETRWSSVMGPFCHAPNVPSAAWTPKLECRQRVIDDAADGKDEDCKAYVTKHDCLFRGAGVCHYIDVCQKALDEFDTWSYCYEIMRTEEPAVLRGMECAKTCDYDELQKIDWDHKCTDFDAHVPAAFAACGRNLDTLCDAGAGTVNDAVKDCVDTLPADGFAVHLDAVDSSSFCWELSDQNGASAYPFDFYPLLDTPKARHLQSAFDVAFVEKGERDACLKDVAVNVAKCAALPQIDQTPARVLYACRTGDVVTVEQTNVAGGGVSCEALPTVRDLNPFALHCAGGYETLSDVSYEEAVRASLDRDCSLVIVSGEAFRAEGVRVDHAAAALTCRRVLDAHDPTGCSATCGEDDCVDLGVTADGKRVFECQPTDDTFVVVDESGKCDRCQIDGADCSITGREGGAQYRCVMPEALFDADKTPMTFAPCRDGLLMHLDSTDATVAHGAGGTYDIVDGVASAAVAGKLPKRFEFDVALSSGGKGKVALEGTKGTIAAVLFHYGGGGGVDLNQPDENADACPAGQGDTCRLQIVPGQSYRVLVLIDDDAKTVTLRIGDTEIVRDMLKDSNTNNYVDLGTFAGVKVTGTARARDVWVFAQSDDACADVHRKLGRSVTFREALQPATALPQTSMHFCADLEATFFDDLKACSSARSAMFSMPWRAYCAYADDHLRGAALSDQQSCGGVAATRDDVRKCQTTLSRFADQTCAKSAAAYDWDGLFCAPLQKMRLPDEIATAGCSAACVDELLATDLGEFCREKKEYWNADGTAKSFLPAPCADNGAWSDKNRIDWSKHCTELAENKVEGVCSAAVCSCRDQGGWMSGQACALSCPLGTDYSPCNEDSFGGVCDYRDHDKEAAEKFYDDPVNNLISQQTLFELQGVCKCRHKDAMHEEGCKVECSKDGAEACNTRTYASDGVDYEISACDAGGSGVCKCMTPLTRQVLKTVSSWKGKTAEVLVYEFGDYSPTMAYKDTSAFRLYAQQGAKRLMTKFFNADEAVWEAERLRFESKPGLYECAPGVKCTFHDVLVAQGVFASSSFYGATCSRRCPGVDTGEGMVDVVAGCDPDASTLVVVDRISEEGCAQECLDDFRCHFTQFVAATSDCKIFADCVAPIAAPVGVWKERKIVREPNMTPCSGRGACGVTGQCRCDAAMYLNPTNPITGEKTIIQSNMKGTLKNMPITTLDTTPYRGAACEKVCPGYDEVKKSMADVCSGHGVCTRAGACQCDVNWVGINCELRCPVKDVTVTDDQTVCSGHGTCSEQRVFAGADLTEEDSKRYYMVTEAYRRFYNECPDNTEKIDYFVMPVGDIFAGTVRSENLKGGPNCESVPQEQDDPTKPFVKRPEITLKGLRDFKLYDSESDLKDEGFTGVVGDYGFNRKGMFRRHFYKDANDAVQQQTLFVVDHNRVGLYDSAGDTDAALYDRFFGYRCGGDKIDSTVAGLETAGDCARRCASDDRCMCFHYQEHYHSKFMGACTLAKDGPLVSIPVQRALQIGSTMGLLELSASGEPLPFEAFSDSYVALFADEDNPESCRAPKSLLGNGVKSINACAAKCVAQRDSGCFFFEYDKYTLTCNMVRTTTADCVEGLVQSTAGFYAVSLPNTGALAPTAYSVRETARIFPKTVTEDQRGTVSGVYVGRARPNFETAIASCDCLSNAAWGWWAGHRCQTCQKWYGSKTCSRKCPNVVNDDEACSGFGSCIWGSKNAEGEVFYDSRCLCGTPSAPYSEDLASPGIWEVKTFDLHVEATFKSLPEGSEFYENPLNYNFASSVCSGCKSGFGGLNCASQCSYCLFGGQCNFLPSTVSISVPCNCLGGDYDPYNSCCPVGFTLLRSLIHNDIGNLITTLRNDRLSQQPGANADPLLFYNTAVFPNIMEAVHPSRKWCVPCPGVYESSWMTSKAVASSTACSSLGDCRDRGNRRLTVGAAPSKYFPQQCSELGSDDLGNLWVSHRRVMWYASDGQVFLDTAENTQAVSLTYQGAGDVQGSAATDAEYASFVEGCMLSCGAAEDCTGITVKRKNDAGNTVVCYNSQYFLLGKSHYTFYETEEHKESTFVSYRKRVQSEFCRQRDGTDVCALSNVEYSGVSLCADLPLSSGLTFDNLGVYCRVYDEDTQTWSSKQGSDCSVQCRVFDDAAQTWTLKYDEAECPYSDTNSRVERVEVDFDEDVSVRQDNAPSATALVYGAYGTSKFTASAGEAPRALGVMRPENPCNTLAGDYYWNKDNREQCISASTKQTCDIKDWDLCINTEDNDYTKRYVHPYTNFLAVSPHKVSVLGEDVELAVFKTQFPWRRHRAVHTDEDKFGAPDLLPHINHVNSEKASLELMKNYYNTYIVAMQNERDFQRKLSGRYDKYRVYTVGDDLSTETDVVDLSFATDTDSFSTFFYCMLYKDRNSDLNPNKCDVTDAVTWPKNQGRDCPYDVCIPMGAQQLVDVTRVILDFLIDAFLESYDGKETTYTLPLAPSDFMVGGTKLGQWPYTSAELQGLPVKIHSYNYDCLTQKPECVPTEKKVEQALHPTTTDDGQCLHTFYRYFSGDFDSNVVSDQNGNLYDVKDTNDAYYRTVCPVGCDIDTRPVQQSVYKLGDCVTCMDSVDNDKACYSEQEYAKIPEACYASDKCPLRDTFDDHLDGGTFTQAEVNSWQYAEEVDSWQYPEGKILSDPNPIEIAKRHYDAAVERLEYQNALVKRAEDDRAQIDVEIANLEALDGGDGFYSYYIGEKEKECTNDFPCDICEGHCDQDSECRGDLLCQHAITPRASYAFAEHHCSGTKPSGVNHCLPPTAVPSDVSAVTWSSSADTELYLAGAVLKPLELSLWLLEVKNNKVLASHSRTDHAYTYSTSATWVPPFQNPCPASHPELHEYKESGWMFCYVEYKDDDPDHSEACSMDGSKYPPPYNERTKTLAVWGPNQDACVLLDRTPEVHVYHNINSGVGNMCKVHGNRCPTRLNSYCDTVSHTCKKEGIYGVTVFSVIFLLDHVVKGVRGHDLECYVVPYTFYRDASYTFTTPTGHNPETHTQRPIGDPYILRCKALYGNPLGFDFQEYKEKSYTMFMDESVEDRFVDCVWWKDGYFYTFKENSDGTNVGYKFKTRTDYERIPADDLTGCGESKLSLERRHGPYDFAINDTDTIKVKNLEVEFMMLTRSTLDVGSRSQPSTTELTGIVKEDGVTGFVVKYNHGPWTDQAAMQRVLTVDTPEDCYRHCEYAYGCTAMEYHANADKGKRCTLYQFDPTDGCDIFDKWTAPTTARENNDQPNMNLGRCKSDCDGDADCASGLRCFQRSNGEYAPGCGSGANYDDDICYDPAASSLAMIRKPNACHLCKSRGMHNYVNIDFTETDMENNVYCTDVETVVRKPKSACKIFPVANTGAEDPMTVTQCPPTRTGLDTSMYTTSRRVGFDIDMVAASASLLIDLTGVSSVNSAEQCEIACVETAACKAWRFEKSESAPWDSFTPMLADATCSADKLIQETINYGQKYVKTLMQVGQTSKTDLQMTKAQAQQRCESQDYRLCSASDIRGVDLCYDYGWTSNYHYPFFHSSRSSCGSSRGNILDLVVKAGNVGNAHCCEKLTTLDDCVSLCKSDPGCEFIHYTSAKDGYCRLYERDGCTASSGVGAVDATVWRKAIVDQDKCKLFASAAHIAATTNSIADTRASGISVGVVEKDFNPKTAYFDDGEHAACDCYDGSTAYDCACSAQSFAPFGTNATNDVYGCSGHGQCSSLEYKCICDEGYSWQYVDAQNGNNAGYTCAVCPKGTYKDASVSVCTLCPLRFYSDSVGATSCTACPSGGRTLARGADSADLCV